MPCPGSNVCQVPLVDASCLHVACSGRALVRRRTIECSYTGSCLRSGFERSSDSDPQRYSKRARGHLRTRLEPH